MSRGPVFVERRQYRRRRALDAVRLLPLVGLLLFLTPLLWSAAGPEPTLNTARWGLYLFGIWGLLIAGNVVFARFFGGGAGRDGPDP